MLEVFYCGVRWRVSVVNVTKFVPSERELLFAPVYATSPKIDSFCCHGVMNRTLDNVRVKGVTMKLVLDVFTHNL